jgi:hypothetical protein
MADPGVPAPPIPPALGAPAPPGVVPTTYREYYDNEANDTAGGDYGPIMATFVVPVAGAPPPQQVSDAVYASAIVDPQAFVLLVTDDNHPDGRVTLFHRLQRYEPRLGRPTPFDGTGYAFYGDVVHGQVPPSIEWPTNAFHQVNAAVRVPQRQIIEEWLVAEPDLPLMDPPDAAGGRVRSWYAFGTACWYHSDMYACSCSAPLPRERLGHSWRGHFTTTTMLRAASPSLTGSG